MRFELNLVSSKEENFSVCYELNNHSFANKWYKSFQSQELNDLRPGRDIFNNFNISKEQLSQKIARLQELIDFLNTFVSPKITDHFNPEKPKESVNKLHVHFPEHERSESRKDRILALSEYNDLIHYLESYYGQEECRKKWGIELAHLALCFKSSPRYNIKDEEWNLFSKSQFFGEVVSHYPHVGRHPLEIFWANDRNVPNNQILSQYEIAADSLFHFGSTLRSTEEELSKFDTQFKNFYHEFGEDRWPIKINDPRIALGSVQVARLVNDFNAKPEVQKQYREMLQNSTLKGIKHFRS